MCVSVYFLHPSESSNKENSDSPEWSFTTVRKKKSDGRKVLNGTVRRTFTTWCCYWDSGISHLMSVFLFPPVLLSSSSSSCRSRIIRLSHPVWTPSSLLFSLRSVHRHLWKSVFDFAAWTAFCIVFFLLSWSSNIRSTLSSDWLSKSWNGTFDWLKTFVRESQTGWSHTSLPGTRTECYLYEVSRSSCSSNFSMDVRLYRLHQVTLKSSDYPQ